MGNKRVYTDIAKLYLKLNNSDKAKNYLSQAKEHGLKVTAPILKDIDFPSNVNMLEKNALLKKDIKGAIKFIQQTK